MAEKPDKENDTPENTSTAPNKDVLLIVQKEMIAQLEVDGYLNPGQALAVWNRLLDTAMVLTDTGTTDFDEAASQLPIATNPELDDVAEAFNTWLKSFQTYVYERDLIHEEDDGTLRALFEKFLQSVKLYKNETVFQGRRSMTERQWGVTYNEKEGDEPITCVLTFRTHHEADTDETYSAGLYIGNLNVFYFPDTSNFLSENINTEGVMALHAHYKTSVFSKLKKPNFDAFFEGYIMELGCACIEEDFTSLFAEAIKPLLDDIISKGATDKMDCTK